MATLVKAGEKPVPIILENGEEDIKKLLDCPFPEQLPLGSDPKKPIQRTVWLHEDREIFDMPLNKEATAIVDSLTTPTKEALTHRMFGENEEGEEIVLGSSTAEPTKFPPIKGDVIITNFEEDGL